MQFSVVCVGYDAIFCISRMATIISEEIVGPTYRASFPKL